MEIAKWMSRRVYTIKPLDSIRHAREIMETLRINQLPVVVDNRLVGIVTDRDLRDAFPSVFEPPAPGAARKATVAPDPGAVTVETVMTPNVLTLRPTDTMEEAARVMRRERIGAIPIVDAGRLVGVVARSDVLDAFVALSESVKKGSTSGSS